MPVSRNITQATRETTDLHAPWWSEEKDENGRYLERVVVYAQRFHVDDQWIQLKCVSQFDAKKKTFDTSAGVKAARVTFQRMIVEITDAKGIVQPKTATGENGQMMYSSSFIEGMDARDFAFIEEFLDGLKEPPVPVTEQDEATAEKRTSRLTALKSQGYSDDHPVVQSLKTTDVEEIAQDRFHRHVPEPLHE